jgi:hypothetical protein
MFPWVVVIISDRVRCRSVPGTGCSPTSEPRSRILADWSMARRYRWNIKLWTLEPVISGGRATSAGGKITFPKLPVTYVSWWNWWSVGWHLPDRWAHPCFWSISGAGTWSDPPPDTLSNDQFYLQVILVRCASKSFTRWTFICAKSVIHRNSNSRFLNAAATCYRSKSKRSVSSMEFVRSELLVERNSKNWETVDFGTGLFGNSSGTPALLMQAWQDFETTPIAVKPGFYWWAFQRACRFQPNLTWPSLWDYWWDFDSIQGWSFFYIFPCMPPLKGF